MQGILGHCLTTSVLAEHLDLGSDVSTALKQFFARWDGRGVPPGVGGTDLALPVRLFHLADVVEVHHRNGGIDAARRVALQRSGKQFDPAIVEAFADTAAEVLEDHHPDRDALDVINDEPTLRRPLSDAELDVALGALADFTDLRSMHRGGHSRGVADLAGAVASALGLPQSEVVTTRRAGFVHDNGQHGVPATTLDKPGALTSTERERFRAAAYYTERVLARPVGLARIGAVASAVHERLDGSGYHRGAGLHAVAMPGRVLATACAFRAMTEPRAHRPALTVKQAGAQLRADARAGRLDPDAVEAVLTTAGAGGGRRVSGPSGLTGREVEVLRLIARGTTTRDVAAHLGISPKTAGTHIERIYAKTGASSRSTATLFALRNGLLDPLEL
jgi:HD-GYP domain-containing protein (c-di-GMP phosphodiesterase class II)/DNA-binding CsgD family transcriptional regulator